MTAIAAEPAAVILREQIVDGVLRLTLDNPSRRNALSEAMMAALQSALDWGAGDSSVKVVILAATGPAFCSGHDLKEITARRTDADQGRGYFTGLMTACSRLMTTITRLPKPVIAEVQGVATAAGCQLVASADLAVASDKASFATPGVHIGLFCSTPMVALSRSVARKHALEMLFTGEPIDADTARDIGLVNKVVPARRLTTETMELAAKIADKSGLTLKLGKAAFYAQADMGLDAAYAHASQVMVDNLLTQDAGEGIAAFIAKRPAVWTGR